VFTGKDRVFNRRFLIMADHYMVELLRDNLGESLRQSG
ncbi:MAG: hypothetical protein RL480_488, partial [Pseudomonadota bacterium]